MDFTQYSQLLSYVEPDSILTVLDIMGQPLDTAADIPHRLNPETIQFMPDVKVDAILLRFALSRVDDPYTYASHLMPWLKSGGYMIVQDFLMPDNKRVTDYINGFIHIFDKKHRKSFAQYEWDGLVLDVGLRIRTTKARQLETTLQACIEKYQPISLDQQHATIMLIQAPDAVHEVMRIKYAGTPYAKFELQELICVAQKE